MCMLDQGKYIQDNKGNLKTYIIKANYFPPKINKILILILAIAM